VYKEELTMAVLTPPTTDRSLLRRATETDAAVSGVSATLLLATSAALGPLLGIPASYLFGVGLVFVPFAAFAAYAATRPKFDRRLGWALVVMNSVWVILSGALLISDVLPLTPAGFWFVVAQAVVVDLIAVAQYLGLRRLP
jgi:hypothetical protein